jgi:hypothetical protein
MAFEGEHQLKWPSPEHTQAMKYSGVETMCKSVLVSPGYRLPIVKSHRKHLEEHRKTGLDHSTPIAQHCEDLNHVAYIPRTCLLHFSPLSKTTYTINNVIRNLLGQPGIGGSLLQF